MKEVSVIIPTMASEARARHLRAALDSLNVQRGARALPIVVVNGSRYDEKIFSALKRDRGLRCIYREEAGAPYAVAEGRCHVDTEFFGVLDDDDVYLPNALEVRSMAFNSASAVDVVVTNGYDRTPEGLKLKIASLREAESRPATFMLKYNWLPSAAGLFRTDSVASGVFASAPPILEWTYIGLCLSVACKIRFVDEPTFVITVGSPQSVSASERYLELQPAAIRTMTRLPLPATERKVLEWKRAAAFHELAEYARLRGEIRRAMGYHLSSLVGRGGFRYLSYTRKLLSI